jgi:hypothetical protein
MDTLPFLQKIVAARDCLSNEAPHVRPLDADAGHHFGRAIGSKQVDFRLSRSGDVDMRRFVIDGVDNEPEAVSAVDDNHRLI